MPAQPSSHRVVEAVIPPINWRAIKLPKVDTQPLRCAADQVMLTGLGIGILAARGVRSAFRAAYRAGSEAAEHPGPVTGSLLKLVGHDNVVACEDKPIIRQVPVLPIANYHELSEAEIIGRLETLSIEQVHVVKTYEETHLNRQAIITALRSRLQR